MTFSLTWVYQKFTTSACLLYVRTTCVNCLLCLLLQLLYDTIKLCLVKATAAGMTSAAFPTVGCGRLGYDPRDVADCFLRAQRDTGCQLRVCIKETLTTQRSHFPCGRLSWLPVSFLLHVKHTISYRIVSYFYQPWLCLSEQQRLKRLTASFVIC